MKLRAVLPSAAIALVIASSAASAAPVERFSLYENSYGASCDGSGLAGPDPPVAAPWFGDVTFSVHKGVISAKVKIRGGSPPPSDDPWGARYMIRLVQGPADCMSEVTEFTLNEAGKGTITVSEAVVSNFAFVHIDVLSAPSFDPDRVFVTETFRH